MGTLKTTAGRVLVNEALPPDLRDYDRTMTKQEMKSLLQRVATETPERYAQVAQALLKVGQRAAADSGGYSIGLDDLETSQAALKHRAQIRQELGPILNNPDLSDEQVHRKIIQTVGAHMKPQTDEILAEAEKAGNPIARQILSGARGNPTNLSTLLGSDLLYSDYSGDPAPVPILHSYSEGLKPWEVWSGTYGARTGVLAVKLGVRNAGYIGKSTNQFSHRLIVTQPDEDGHDPSAPVGLPVETSDADNEGALLAHPAGKYPRDTVLTPKILHELKQGGTNRILIHSPVAGGPAIGGVSGKQLGVRETGSLPAVGTMAGNLYGQAVGEPISQGTLGTKHHGGIAGQSSALSGFPYYDTLINPPQKFHGQATHAEHDGAVGNIAPAAAGGYEVSVGGHPHYVPPGADLKVKIGQQVEAGDVLSSGIPHPGEIVRHKGLGEGRRTLTHALKDALGSMNIRPNRRNLELMTRGLVDHVRMTDEVGDHGPGDVVPYSTLAAGWTPRPGSESTSPDSAVGRYLEKPVLHYTIGTKVRPSVVRDLREFGVKNVTTHREAPPFEPTMVRGVDNLRHDPDPLTRMYGTNQKGSLLDATHRGLESDASGTSFVPSLAKGEGFGDTWPRSAIKQSDDHPGVPGVMPQTPAQPHQPHPLADNSSFHLLDALAPGTLRALSGGRLGSSPAPGVAGYHGPRHNPYDTGYNPGPESQQAKPSAQTGSAPTGSPNGQPPQASPSAAVPGTSMSPEAVNLMAGLQSEARQGGYDPTISVADETKGRAIQQAGWLGATTAAGLANRTVGGVARAVLPASIAPAAPTVSMRAAANNAMNALRPSNLPGTAASAIKNLPGAATNLVRSGLGWATGVNAVGEGWRAVAPAGLGGETAEDKDQRLADTADMHERSTPTASAIQALSHPLTTLGSSPYSFANMIDITGDADVRSPGLPTIQGIAGSADRERRLDQSRLASQQQGITPQIPGQPAIKPIQHEYYKGIIRKLYPAGTTDGQIEQTIRDPKLLSELAAWHRQAVQSGQTSAASPGEVDDLYNFSQLASGQQPKILEQPTMPGLTPSGRAALGYN